MKGFDQFKSIEELAEALGFTDEEAEILSLKGSAIARLDKERRKRDMNNAQFSEFLEIPKSRWSSILNNPNKVSVDYLVGLLV